MRRCPACGIEFTGELEVCPLCQTELEGQAVPSVFPRNEVKRTQNTALRVLSFGTGAAMLTMLYVGAMVGLPRGTTFVACLSMLACFLLVRHILVSVPDFMRIAVRCFLLLLAVAAGAYVATGSTVVTTWVIPGLCLLSLAFDAVVALVFRERFATHYLKYLLLSVLLGYVPLLLAQVGLTSSKVLAYASGLVASVLLLALVVFWRDHLAAEVRKLFTS